jgi:hypothetical protein
MSEVEETKDNTGDAIKEFSSGQPGFQELYGEYEQFVKNDREIDE